MHALFQHRRNQPKVQSAHSSVYARIKKYYVKTNADIACHYVYQYHNKHQ